MLLKQTEMSELRLCNCIDVARSVELNSRQWDKDLAQTKSKIHLICGT